MKNLFLVLLLLITVNVQAQSKESNVLYKNPSPKWDITQTVIDQKDTVVYFYMGYQNKKYTQIRDIGSILISNVATAQEFIDGCRKIVEVPDKTEYVLKVHNFTLIKYEFSRSIFIVDRNNKYTTLSKNQILTLAATLESKLSLFRE
jgi:hypothetical protein